VARKNPKKQIRYSDHRLTISLGPDQRERLELVADFNRTSEAQIVRKALDAFFENGSEGDPTISIPDEVRLQDQEGKKS